MIQRDKVAQIRAVAIIMKINGLLLLNILEGEPLDLFIAWGGVGNIQ